MVSSKADLLQEANTRWEQKHVMVRLLCLIVFNIVTRMDFICYFFAIVTFSHIKTLLYFNLLACSCPMCWIE